VVLQLASELHVIAPLPIASYGEYMNIAKALLDVGCSSLMSLVVLPEDPINSVGDLQSYLQILKYPLGKLQLCTMLKWIQQQRHAPAFILDVGSKRAHPESPKRAPAATPAHLEPLLPMQSLRRMRMRMRMRMRTRMPPCLLLRQTRSKLPTSRRRGSSWKLCAFASFWQYRV
jgi:hypothetical protein